MSTRLGLVRCEFCQRQFNPHSAARHVPWCRKQQNESRRHRASDEKRELLERYRWRVNYKPSNAIQQRRQQRPNSGSRDNNSTNNDNPAATGPAGRQTKPFQVFSSSLSSPSNGSSASIGSTLALEQPIAARRTAGRPGRDARRPPAPAAALKRSVSSLTMTRQRGALVAGASGARSPGKPADVRRAASLFQNSKSVGDLKGAASEMSDMVDTLAKKMEQIYQQNKCLLEKIAAGARAPCDSSRGPASARSIGCRRCGTLCSADSNYCRKCGAQVAGKCSGRRETPSDEDDHDDHDGGAGGGGRRSPGDSSAGGR